MYSDFFHHGAYMCKSLLWMLFSDSLPNQDIWDVNTLQFYSDSACSILEGSSQKIASSWNLSPPSNAFDGDIETIWSGRQNSDGIIWIGLDFGNMRDNTSIKCVKISDGSKNSNQHNSARKVFFEYHQSGGWKNRQSFTMPVSIKVPAHAPLPQVCDYEYEILKNAIFFIACFVLL